MDDLELIKIIDSHTSLGIGGQEGEISQTRQTILDRYLGELYGDEEVGRSKITTREVFETVEWALPSIVRVFESGDRVIEFDPTGADDEQGAEQETDAVNHVYRKDNNGFVVTHNIIKSALLNPNSYVKVYREESEEVSTETYKNMNEMELAALDQDPEIEFLSAEQTEYGFTVEIKRTCKKGKNKVQCIPEEEIIIDNNHSELSLDECEFVCHRVEKTQSDLLKQGYKKKDLDIIASDDEHTSEESNRNYYSDERDYDDETHEALRKFTVYECYMLLDNDGDGIAERRRVVKIGNKIFENEEIDMMPIASAASMIMPHKHTGYSLAQSIIDLQDLKTYFMRQTVNNMAKVNNPRTLITKDANLKDVLSTKNNIIRIKQPGDVTTEPTQPVIGQVLPLLQLIDEQKEGRSGITRNSMGLDADVLAKSTEGAFMGAIEKAEQRVEFIVRVFAETVFKDIFLKIHHLILTHGDAKEMKLNGQWVLVDPSEWKKREAMTVNVGLGLGNRNQKMMAAQMIVQDHDKLIAGGAMGTLISPQNVYNGRRMLVEATGEKSVDRFYINPQMAPPAQPQGPPPPDPNMIMIQSNERIEQGKLQLKSMELQQQGQIEAAKIQFNQAKEQREQQFNQIELTYKQEIERLKTQISQSKNADDASAKELQSKVKSLELQLEDAQQDEKLAMEKYKADLDAETKLAVKRIDVSSQAEPVIEQMQNETNEQLQTMAQIINDMNQPKEIVKDENGTPIGVRNVGTGEMKTIVRDEEGLPVGLA